MTGHIWQVAIILRKITEFKKYIVEKLDFFFSYREIWTLNIGKGDMGTTLCQFYVCAIFRHRDGS